jgi:CubicO group peptidase (beta-lactamase class C family)
MKRLLSLFLVFALLLPFCAFAEEDAEPSAFDHSVDSLFSQYRTRCGEIVVAKEGEIIYQRSYGWADPEKKTPATPDHYYRLASVSKIVTATAFMRLVEFGLVDLDENIGEYLHLADEKPFFAASPRYKKVGITPRMLMSHTACIWCDKFSPRPGVTKALDLQKNKGHKEYFYDDKPGTAYHYSNYGAGILGCMMEAVTGKRLDDAAADLLFDRMGIDAGYSPEYLKVPGNTTSNVVREYGETIDLDNDYVFGYGNCYMKCSDLCKIGMMLCDGGLFEGERILEAETVQEMMSSQKGKGGITVDPPYGLNVLRVDFSKLFDGRLVYGHQGVIDNILCLLIFDPESRFVFAMTSVCRDPMEQIKVDGGLRALDFYLLRAAWNEFGK